MKTMSDDEFRKKVADMIVNRELDPETDNVGQIIFYTGYFENSEGVVQDEPDPEVKKRYG